MDPNSSLWPFRPHRLSDLLELSEIRELLGFGVPFFLQSDVTLLENAEAESCTRVDPEPAGSYASPFCSYLRRGKIAGKLAFDGANEECERCEERFARRVLKNAADRSVSRARCHMGLYDFAAQVVVKDVVVATVIAGQRVESEEQRGKINRTVGKLGKLTRGEIRSLEEAGAPVVASIRPQEGRARELLLQEVVNIPRLSAEFPTRLQQLADRISHVASRRFEWARRAWEDALLEELVPDVQAHEPRQKGQLLDWLERSIRALRDRLGVEYAVLFGRPPEQIGEKGTALPLLAECGLSLYGRPDLLADGPLLELDVARLAHGGDDETECVERSMNAVSTLISAIRSTERSPPGWKDRVTKCIFVPAVLCREGLEMVMVFGPATASAEPEREDFAFLWRATQAIAERYQLGAAEARCRQLAKDLKKHEKPAAAKSKPSPIRSQRFDLRKLLDQCLDVVSPQASANHVSFDPRRLPERFMLEADRPKLKAVFELLLGYAAENARPREGQEAAASVLLSLRRLRRSQRVSVVIDMVGRYLDTDERRALFRKPSRAPNGEEGRGRPEPGSPRALNATRPGEAGDDASPAPAERAASEETGSRGPSPPICFREARRYLSWHGGNLVLEATRTRPVEGNEGVWMGRTILTATFPTRQAERSERHQGKQRREEDSAT